MNPRAISPNMPPTGSTHPLVYVLGEAPGKDEDKRNEQFVGRSGELLRDCIPEEFDNFITFDNCCRTRPPNNRTPTAVEVECFRPSIIRCIEKTEPKAILGTGAVPLYWAVPGVQSVKRAISICRGRRFPVRIGKHNCWFYSIHHPAYILRVQGNDKVRYIDSDVPGEELRTLFNKDIVRIFRQDLEPPEVESTKREDLFKGVKLLTDLEDIKQALKKLSASKKPVAIDIETSHLRPYSDGAKLLSVAIGSYGSVVAFPVQHTKGLSGGSQRAILGLLRAFLLSRPKKIAHNLTFELEWFLHLFGVEVLREVRWEDTMVQAYALDERIGGHSLDFLCQLYYGLPLKSLSDVNQGRLEEESIKNLLQYNSLDTKYTSGLYSKQRRLLKKEGLKSYYDNHLDRVPSTVYSQRLGLPVDVDRVEHFRDKFSKKLKKVKKKLEKQKEVKQFRKEFKIDFRPTSNKHLPMMFRDLLGRKEGKRGNKYSTDKKVLEQINLPIARLLLELRSLNKLKGTYIDPFHPDDKHTLIYPDGLLHPTVKVIFVSTGRLSYEEPNAQNFPKREHPEIRSIIAAPDGYLLVSFDYGQIEARVIAILSEDAYLMKALWEEYDIHLEWAEKIADVCPSLFEDRGGEIDKFRSEIKNQLVFPAFYGASVGHVTNMLELPGDIGRDIYEEFWETFEGVRTWQRELRRFYRRNGYVECLNGRRRREPLSDNMVINSGVQGSASDIVVDAMNRLNRYAIETGKHYYQPILNVHDDLTFLIPENRVEKAIPRIAKMMVSLPYDWVNVPIEVEAAKGRNWHELEKVGKFRSDRI
jgi:uracil-DNA glycosylase family 4